jgi:hypothetical protein
MYRKAGGIIKAEKAFEGRVYFIAREAVFSLSPSCSSMLQQGVQLPVSATQAGSTLITEMTGGWGVLEVDTFLAFYLICMQVQFDKT